MKKDLFYYTFELVVLYILMLIFQVLLVEHYLVIANHITKVLIHSFFTFIFNPITVYILSKKYSLYKYINQKHHKNNSDNYFDEIDS